MWLLGSRKKNKRRTNRERSSPVGVARERSSHVNPGRYVVTNSSEQVDVSDLQIGMYVCELDRPWEDSPFLVQGFYLENWDHLHIVQDVCEHVFIDVSRKEWVETKRSGSSSRHSRQSYENLVSARQEHAVARDIYQNTGNLTASLMSEVRMGNSLNTKKAKLIVGDVIESILRNPNAMLWMTRIRDKDEATAAHSLSVCILATAFGRYLGYSKEDLGKLSLCALLHDIGKMGWSDELLHKKGALTESERLEMQKHCARGRDILIAQTDLYYGVVDVAFGHHERYDGKGYPNQRSGQEITQYNHIVSLADAYDAMTRPKAEGLEPMSSTDALKIIYTERGKQFEPHMALKFIDCVGVYPPGSIVELKNGLVGVVLAANPHNKLLPRIIVVHDPSQEKTKEKVVDLEQTIQSLGDEGYYIKDVLPHGSHGVDIDIYKQKGLFALR